MKMTDRNMMTKCVDHCTDSVA